MNIEELKKDPNMPTSVGVGRVAVLLDEIESRTFGGMVDFSKNEPMRRGEIVLIGEPDGIYPISENVKVGATCSAISWSGKQIVKLENGRELAIVYHADLTLFFG